MKDIAQELKEAIRRIPDFPKKGIVFRDLTTLWKDGELLRKTTDVLHARYRDKGIDKVVGIEARGFIVGAPLADRLVVGFIPARKLGKLPSKKVKVEYRLEYGIEGLEVHNDAIEKGDHVLIVDDLLATGGTSLAAASLVDGLGGTTVGFAFIVELSFLKGRERLSRYDVFSMVKYESEKE